MGNALAEDTLRDILDEKEAHVPSAKSYQRCQQVAKKVLQMQEVLTNLSEAAEWDEDAVNELTLNKWASAYRSPEDIFLYGFHSSMSQGQYVKTEAIANNMPVYECQHAPRFLSYCEEKDQWWITAEDSIGESTGWAH